MDKWIKCSERLPEPGRRVLVYSDYWSSEPFIAKLEDGEWVGWNILSKPASVTHWQPLPAPPEAA